MAGGVRDDFSAFTSGGPFAGFADEDFDAYVQKKWRSNAYTLARRKAKDKLLAVAHQVVAELEEEIGRLELHGSDEAPSMANGRSVEAQWAFFTRDSESRAALRPLLNTTDLHAGSGLFDIALQHQHACLALRLDDRGVSVGVEIAGKARVDRDNVAKKLEQSWARTKLVELCQALPGGTLIGLGEGLAEAIDIDTDRTATWPAALTDGADLFVATRLVPREEPIVSTQALIGTVTELVAEFLPVYEFLAWSRDNDYTQVGKALKKSVTTQARAAPTMQPGDRVTILAGLFAGRSGYLAEVDGKGKAKVMVGPVSVNVEAKDLKSM